MKKILLLLILFSFGCESPKDKITNPVGMTFVYIEPGTFMMGPNNEYYVSAAYQNTTPREVTLTKGFYLQTTETTVGQWKKFTKATGYKTQAEIQGFGYSHIEKKYDYKSNYRGKKVKNLYWNKPGFKITDKYPVTQISWNDSQKFIEWLNVSYGKHYRIISNLA